MTTRTRYTIFLLLLPSIAIAEQQVVSPSKYGSNIVAGQGYNPGSSGQGFNPGLGGGSSGQGFNPGLGGGSSGQGFNPGLGGGSSSSAPCYNPVAFTARRATAYSRGRPGQLVFERTVTNLGGGWNGATGQFGAPHSGTYHFSWAALSPANRQLRLALVRNGQEQAASWADMAGFQTASGTAAITLRRGDTVYLYIEEGQVYEPSNSARGYTTFTGYRVG